MTKRVENGVVYTPMELGKQLAEMVRKVSEEYGIPINSVYDPACGVGDLLRAFILAPGPWAHVHRHNYSGHDIDGGAVLSAHAIGFSVSKADLFDLAEPLPADCLMVVNPPYVGRANLSRIVGQERFKWLKTEYKAKAAGSCDLAGYVMRHVLQKRRPAISAWIVTNTVAQGSTRRVGLQWALANGYRIVDATDNIQWPGSAAVSVRLFVMVDGDRFPVASARFNSRLLKKPERGDPAVLSLNAGCAYVGSYVLGMGFVLTPEEREELVSNDSSNVTRIFPYLGGEEVNTSPTQSPHRYVINFEQMVLEEAECWPDLLDIVREKVKPERDKNNRDQYRKYWWHFGEKRPALYSAIRPLPRCLVTALSSKHHAFTFLPTSIVLDQTLICFALSGASEMAVLNSRIHEPWRLLFGATLGETPRYNPSRCFDTFPFPQPDPRTVIPSLEAIGEELYEARAHYMIENDVGLTITYNRLKDPSNQDRDIVRLRQLHEEMDRQVLLAYGWDDLAGRVPPFEIKDEKWQDEIIDRLFVLNAERAKQQ